MCLVFSTRRYSLRDGTAVREGTGGYGVGSTRPYGRVREGTGGDGRVGDSTCWYGLESTRQPGLVCCLQSTPLLPPVRLVCRSVQRTSQEIQTQEQMQLTPFHTTAVKEWYLCTLKEEFNLEAG